MISQGSTDGRLSFPNERQVHFVKKLAVAKLKVDYTSDEGRFDPRMKAQQVEKLILTDRLPLQWVNTGSTSGKATLYNE